MENATSGHFVTGSVIVFLCGFRQERLRLPPGRRCLERGHLAGGANRLSGRQRRATALSTIPSAATRHIIGNWQNAHKEQTKKLCMGTAILISSRLVRGALTAMNWVHEPVIKQYYPNTRREALDWCITTVDDAGLTINSRALAVLKSRDG